jgi:hypothetical protein
MLTFSATFMMGLLGDEGYLAKQTQPTRAHERRQRLGNERDRISETLNPDALGCCL